MRSVILALLAPAAIAMTASASAAVPASRARIIESSPVTIDVAYRYARGGGVYAHRGVYARGGGYYGRRGAYASQRRLRTRRRILRPRRRVCAAEAFTRGAADTYGRGGAYASRGRDDGSTNRRFSKALRASFIVLIIYSPHEHKGVFGMKTPLLFHPSPRLLHIA